MSLNAARVEVIVVTYNSALVLSGLLDSLAAGLRGVDWRLTIADNNSSDDSVAVATDRIPGCRIVQTGRNAGYSAAFNRALDGIAGHDAALLLNPDIRLEPDSVLRMYQHLGGTDGQSVGIVVPRLTDETGHLARSLRREPTLARAFGEALLGQRAGRVSVFGETVLDDNAYQTVTVADWATGAAMLISAECLTKAGPWDESFFLYSEETEFALRARDHGYLTVFTPDAAAVHVGGASRVSPALWSLLQVNRVRLYRRRHSAPAAAVFWAIVALREAVRTPWQRRSRAAVAALLRPARVPRAEAHPVASSDERKVSAG